MLSVKIAAFKEKKTIYTFREIKLMLTLVALLYAGGDPIDEIPPCVSPPLAIINFPGDTASFETTDEFQH